MKRKLLVTHSLHRQRFQFPFPPGSILISWDGFPQALSQFYEVNYIPIAEVCRENVDNVDILLLWFDDIYNPNWEVWNWISNQVVLLSWLPQFGKDIELNCPERLLIYERMQKVDIILGVVTQHHHANFFKRDTAIAVDIINSIDFHSLYSAYKDIKIEYYPSDIGTMPHVLEPVEICNWSEFLLSMRIMNLLGYHVGYQSRIYRLNENKDFTNHLRSFGIECSYFPFMDIKDYVVHLSKCKIMFEFHRYDAVSMAIVAALFGKLPSIGSPSWYQKAIFPDFVMESFNLDWIKEVDYKLRSPDYRGEAIQKGYDLARQLDHQVIGHKLYELIETRTK